MEIIQFVADALGDASYLVVSGDAAAVVDPQRDVRPYLAAAAERGATIRYVFETHVHNDYLSGGRELAAHGAEIVAPATSGLQFPHTPVSDGDEMAVGAARIRAVAAPGHTYEHTAYLAIDETGAIRGAFTGGAILMAAAGRSDLLGPDHTEELTRMQWETGRRISAMLPATAEILPTHGAGSFCSTTGTCADRRAPLAVELDRNPLFLGDSYETFRGLQLAYAAPIPGYYRHMAPLNRSGVRVFGEPPHPAPLTPDALRDLLAAGTHVVDARTRFDHAAGHIPGTLGIEDGGSFLAYAGWLLPFNTPLALVTYGSEPADRLTADLFRIGYEEVRGYLPFDEWKRQPLAAIPLVTREEAAAIMKSGSMPVLDVRFAYEQDMEPLPGALRRTIDTFPAWADALGNERHLIVCASGQRATMAASLLRAQGRDVIALADGGASDIRRILG
jgi:hydroxyacylglutathione hydrolase